MIIQPVPSFVDFHILSVASEGRFQIMSDGGGYGNNFALIVVLFILLIIVGAAFVGGWY